MRLCLGTAKGIVTLDPGRRGVPLMVLADPVSVWCMAQDAHDPNLLYAGSVHNAQAGTARGRGSLARSTDGGRSWTDVTPGAARDSEIWAIATAPDRTGEVFIGTSQARLLRSENRGHTFRQCGDLLRPQSRERAGRGGHTRRISAITFDRGPATTLYVGLSEGAVYRSADRGRQFEPLTTAVDEDVNALAVDHDEPRRLGLATARGVYHSGDAGASWSGARGLNRSFAMPLLFSPSGTLYTAAAIGPPPVWAMTPAGADALIFRSLDHGATFAPLPLGDGMIYPSRGLVMHLLASPDDPRMLYGAASDGSVVAVDEQAGSVGVIAEKLPPAYALVALPA